MTKSPLSINHPFLKLRSVEFPRLIFCCETFVRVAIALLYLFKYLWYGAKGIYPGYSKGGSSFLRSRHIQEEGPPQQLDHLVRQYLPHFPLQSEKFSDVFTLCEVMSERKNLRAARKSLFPQIFQQSRLNQATCHS
jgi:hypothetical protein